MRAVTCPSVQGPLNPFIFLFSLVLVLQYHPPNPLVSIYQISSNSNHPFIHNSCCAVRQPHPPIPFSHNPGATNLLPCDVPEKGLALQIPGTLGSSTSLDGPIYHSTIFNITVAKLSYL